MTLECCVDCSAYYKIVVFLLNENVGSGNHFTKIVATEKYILK